MRLRLLLRQLLELLRRRARGGHLRAHLVAQLLAHLGELGVFLLLHLLQDLRAQRRVVRELLRRFLIAPSTALAAVPPSRGSAWAVAASKLASSAVRVTQVRIAPPELGSVGGSTRMAAASMKDTGKREGIVSRRFGALPGSESGWRVDRRTDKLPRPNLYGGGERPIG